MGSWPCQTIPTYLVKLVQNPDTQSMYTRFCLGTCCVKGTIWYLFLLVPIHLKYGFVSPIDPDALPCVIVMWRQPLGIDFARTSGILCKWELLCIFARLLHHFTPNVGTWQKIVLLVARFFFRREQRLFFNLPRAAFWFEARAKSAWVIWNLICYVNFEC